MPQIMPRRETDCELTRDRRAVALQRGEATVETKSRRIARASGVGRENAGLPSLPLCVDFLCGLWDNLSVKARRAAQAWHNVSVKL